MFISQEDDSVMIMFISCFFYVKKKLELKKMPAASAWIFDEVGKRLGSVGCNPNISHV